ncbi:MAG TPA: hypothetical protein VGA60_16265 [Kiloniellales bacterium]|jgi:hypothetical protein
MEDFSGVHFGETNRLPEKYFIEIGRVVVTWAYFEQNFDIWIHCLWEKSYPRKSKPGLIIPFRKRRKLWLELILKITKEKDTINEARDVSSSAGHIRSLRDHVSHGVWLPILKPGSFEHESYRLLSIKSKAPPEGDVLPRTLDDLKLLSNQITKLNARTEDLLKKIFPGGYGVRYP